MRTLTLVVATLAAAAALAVAAGPLDQLPAPVDPREIEMFEPIQNNPAEARSFIATRQYVRKCRANPANPGPMPDGFSWGYMVDGTEQWEIFKIVTAAKVKKSFA